MNAHKRPRALPWTSWRPRLLPRAVKINSRLQRVSFGSNLSVHSSNAVCIHLSQVPLEEVQRAVAMADAALKAKTRAAERKARLRSARASAHGVAPSSPLVA